MKRLLILQLVIGGIFASLFAEISLEKPKSNYPTSFVIIVDKETFEELESEIWDYKGAIEDEDKISVYVMVVKDEKPNSIKLELEKLYEGSPKLEGAVFIGDIPIPMLRGAQHLTSAYKKNEQKYDRYESSVPSDRYYEDFDLKFKLLGQDTTNNLLYYYWLLPESQQKVRKEIYSGRIKAPVNDDRKYEMIEEYLRKVVEAKRNQEILNESFVFTGHGYHSESLNAWNDEILLLREQFPQMFEVGGRLKHIHFRMSPDMKKILMIEMSREELDMAIFHAHGAEETQYLIGYPAAESIEQNVTEMKRYFRSKLRYYVRHGKEAEEVKNYYKNKYKIGDEWFEGAFDDSITAADSTFEYAMDIHAEDLELFSPQAEFIMFDECFNGSFQVENYISGRYIFGSGNVISSVANSVNVLQDKWADKALGLLNYGVSVGNWHKEVNYLENHIIGDPTFHFKSESGIDLNRKIVLGDEDEQYWRGLLSNPSPELRSLAITKLTKLLGEAFIPSLIQIYKEDSSYNVRTLALYTLASTDSEAFHQILSLSIKDPFEFIRRKSAELMGEIGSDEFVEEMIYTMIYDQSKRVSYNIGNALLFVDQDEMIDAAESVISELPLVINKEELMKIFRKIRDKSTSWLYDDILPTIKNDTLEISKRISSVRTLRNYNFTEAIDELITLIKIEETPTELKQAIVEALGWYNYNENRGEIITALNEIIDDGKTDDPLLSEAIKTRNRLISGCNVPITP